jgi:hypothetical protein
MDMFNDIAKQTYLTILPDDGQSGPNVLKTCFLRKSFKVYNILFEIFPAIIRYSYAITFQDLAKSSSNVMGTLTTVIFILST